MKAAHTRPFIRHPRFLQPKLPSQADLADTLGVVLALLLIVAAVWAIFPEPRSTAPAQPRAGLELALSGVVSSSDMFGADALQTLQCSPTGFRLASKEATAFPLSLAFNAPAAANTSANSTFYTLGSNSTLALSIDGSPYTLLSGTVTTTPGVYTFNASFVDAQSQPLQLSGRLSCP